MSDGALSYLAPLCNVASGSILMGLNMSDDNKGRVYMILAVLAVFGLAVALAAIIGD